MAYAPFRFKKHSRYYTVYRRKKQVSKISFSYRYYSKTRVLAQTVVEQVKACKSGGESLLRRVMASGIIHVKKEAP